MIRRQRRFFLISLLALSVSHLPSTPLAWAGAAGFGACGLNELAKVFRDPEDVAGEPWPNSLLAKPALAGMAALSDLTDAPPVSVAKLPAFSEALSQDDRYRQLKEFPIADLMIAPGHRFLRNPDQIRTLAQHIRLTHGGQFKDKSLILNVVVDGQGKARSVDIWDAHHRLVAYLEAGFHTLGELPRPVFRVLVNGQQKGEKRLPHLLPGASLDPRLAVHAMPVDGGSDPGTVSVEGNLSNFDLGSRTTLGRLRENMSDARPRPKVAVYFGTFDPVHEGHIRTAMRAVREGHMDEVVFIPNEKPLHKPNTAPFGVRLRLLERRLASEGHLNVYRGPTDVFLQQYGKRGIYDRIIQLYGTREIYEVFGDDAFEKLRGLNQLDPGQGVRWLVFKREGVTFALPPALQASTQFFAESGSKELSSTEIRRLIQESKRPPADELDPAEWDAIRELGIYGASRKPDSVPRRAAPRPAACMEARP